jgi:hypothetical protein
VHEIRDEGSNALSADSGFTGPVFVVGDTLVALGAPSALKPMRAPSCAPCWATAASRSAAGCFFVVRAYDADSLEHALRTAEKEVTSRGMATAHAGAG